MPRAGVLVLCSGGLDSGVLLADQARQGLAQPAYVSAGLSWEAEELQLLESLLGVPPFLDHVLPLVRLRMDVTDLYPAPHWSLTARPPAYDTPDEDVYLPGRNLLLLAKASVLCAAQGIHRIAMGTLAGNPFPDATPAFFDAMARALSLGLDHEIRIDVPLAGLHKQDVIALGRSLGVPFELTLSCMNPLGGRHCGLCSKCRERRDAFAAACIADPTPYAAPSPRTSERGA